MPYVVTQSCCSDAACVVACPVNAIHPAPGEPGFATAEILFVDPVACVDCGACATACPAAAIVPHTKLTDTQLPFLEINRSYYADNPHPDRTPLALVTEHRHLPVERLRVAVIGAGPAGLYAADELLKYRGVSVDVFDKLPTPHGLARYGVAPDHQHTKQVTDLFDKIEGERGFRYRLNVSVGEDVSHEQLRAAYDAVIYAVGAATDRRLGVDGETLPGSASATDFVAWYNGHPDQSGKVYPLSSERAVVIGNGNVALDVARILTLDPTALDTTDISDTALAALHDSAIREVVVLGRRGPAEAAFTLPELIGLAGITGIDVVVEGLVEGAREGSLERSGEMSTEKLRILADLAARDPRPGLRRIVLRFNTAPVRVLGDSAVTGLEVARTTVIDGRAVLSAETEVIEAGLVLRAIGYRAAPVKDLPFDDQRAVVPNDAGRVEPGVYVAGWIKRGPTGFLGTNKSCSEETVESLLEDLDAGLLTAPLQELERLPHEIRTRGWRAIDAIERAAGAAAGRPRVKLLTREDLTTAAGTAASRHARTTLTVRR
jgi:ferredoxin--NADP+ reductase